MEATAEGRSIGELINGERNGFVLTPTPLAFTGGSKPTASPGLDDATIVWTTAPVNVDPMTSANAAGISPGHTASMGGGGARSRSRVP